MNGFGPEVVQLGHGIGEEDLLVHQEALDNSSYAYMLSRMEHPHFPLPFGVLRSVQKPSYTDMLGGQVEEAIKNFGEGDLAALYHNSDTWEVK